MKALSNICLFLLGALGTGAQGAGQFHLNGSVIAGGGLTSASADQRFRLIATAGQAEAAQPPASADGRFSLEAGFWHGITVAQSAGAPLLRIRVVGPGEVVLSWPLTAVGFDLEETSAIGEVKWTTTQAAVVDTAKEHTVTVRAEGVVKCYRLRKK